MSSECPLDDALQTYTNGHIVAVMKHWIQGAGVPWNPSAHVKQLYSYTTTVRTECLDDRSPEGTEPTFETIQHQNQVTSIDPSALTSGVLHDALRRAFVYAKHEGPIRTLCSQVYATLPDTLAIVLLRSSSDQDDIDTRPLQCPLTIDFASSEYNMLLNYDCEPRKYRLVGAILCVRTNPESKRVGYAALMRSPGGKWFLVTDPDDMDNYETKGLPKTLDQVLQYLENPPSGWFVHRLLYRWSRYVLPFPPFADFAFDASLPVRDLCVGNEADRKAYMDAVFAFHLPDPMVKPHTLKVVLEHAPRLDRCRSVDYAAHTDTPPALGALMNPDRITLSALEHVVFRKAATDTPFYVPLIAVRAFLTFRLRSWMAICKAALLPPIESAEDAKLAMDMALKEWLELPSSLRLGWAHVADHFNEVFYGRYAYRDMLEPARKSSPLALFHEQWPLLAHAVTDREYRSRNPDSALACVPESARAALVRDRQLRRQIATEGRAEIEDAFEDLALMRDQMCRREISMSQAVCQTWDILLDWLTSDKIADAILRTDLIVERYGALDLKNSCPGRHNDTSLSGATTTKPSTDAMLAKMLARRDARERAKAEQEAARRDARERAKAELDRYRAQADADQATAQKAQRERFALARWHSWPGKLLERKAAREAALERKEKKQAEEEAARDAREAKRAAKEGEKISAAKAARAEKVATRKAARVCKKNWVDPAKVEEARKAKHSKEESDRKAEAERINKEAEARREAARQAARQAAAPAQAEADASAVEAATRAAARAAKKAADRVAAAEAAAIVEAVETAEAIAAVEAIEAAEAAVAPPSPASTSTLASTAASMAASSWEPVQTIDIECLICMDNRMDTMCLPCTHLCVCSKCVAGTSPGVCPKCRTPIERFQSVSW
jgi:hypothetical protein